MKRLNDLMVIPPGGYRWFCRKHGIRFKANFFPELLENVRAYMLANHMEMPVDLVAYLQDEMCEQNGWGDGTCHSVE
jgi:hypothetical protein